jgi:sporulation protein YlmC with PRC-barrel domain
MKFSSNAKIFTTHGQDIGRLKRLVMDPKSGLVTHLVLQRGLLTPKEYLIPVELVDHAEDDQIHLTQLPVDNPDDLPPFQEEEYIITNENSLNDLGTVGDEPIGSYYYYPPVPFGASGMVRPTESFMRQPPETPPFTNETGVPVTGESPVLRQTEENIPDGTVAMKEGARVISSDSRHIGNVEKVFVDPQSRRATHFLVSKGILFKEQKLVPIDWVDQVDEDSVYLVVDKALAERLPDYKE